MNIRCVRCRCGTMEVPSEDEDVKTGVLLVDACVTCYEDLLVAKNAVVKENWYYHTYIPPSSEELDQYAGEWV